MHFNFEMGNMMLADMFGKNPEGPKFGHPITTKNIEADFRYFLQERTEYLQYHPEFHTDMQTLQQICSDPASKCRPF
jgi:hypothetical protein